VGKLNSPAIIPAKAKSSSFFGLQKMQGVQRTSRGKENANLPLAALVDAEERRVIWGGFEPEGIAWFAIASAILRVH
jgi:hypothetical protein